MAMKIITKSTAETQELANNIAKEIIANKRPNLVLLEGELGGGKTTFTQGFIAGLGIKQNVTSPTFVIMKPYKVPDSEYKVYHFDLYRLSQEWEVLDLGIMDLLQNPQNILLVEWASKTPKLWENLPHSKIEFEVFNVTVRNITINP
jgi:tRNA threonylcarbamoyladenosine biosynthesis protein TsaE